MVRELRPLNLSEPSLISYKQAGPHLWGSEIIQYFRYFHDLLQCLLLYGLTAVSLATWLPDTTHILHGWKLSKKISFPSVPMLISVNLPSTTHSPSVVEHSWIELSLSFYRGTSLSCKKKKWHPDSNAYQKRKKAWYMQLKIVLHQKVYERIYFQLVFNKKLSRWWFSFMIHICKLLKLKKLCITVAH